MKATNIFTMDCPHRHGDENRWEGKGRPCHDDPPF